MRNWKDNPIRIVALCKTFGGEEFVHPMLDCLYNHVDKIVFVHSNVSWTGEIGNTVYPEVQKWPGDNLNKIVNLHFDTQNQVEQYDFGYKWIKKNYASDFVMLIDTDEIWEGEDVVKCKRFLQENDGQAFTVAMRTYIKSPFYRLSNIEPCRPTIFVRSSEYSISGVRGNSIKPRVNIPDVYMHHFTYVRKTDEDVISKIKSSTKEDHLSTVDLDLWVKEKWDKLPDSSITNLHTSRGYEHYWKSVEIITKNELPSVFRNREFPIIQQNTKTTCGLKETQDIFLKFKKSKFYTEIPYGELEQEDEKLLFDLSSKCGTILETGTFLGRSSCILGNNVYNSKVDTLDIFENIELIKDTLNREHYSRFFKQHPHYYKDVKKNLSKYGVKAILRKDNFLNEIRPEYDGMFFDADHSYTGVKEDFNFFIRFLKKGGMFAFHDSVRNEKAPHHGVYKFIEDTIQTKYSKIMEGGSITIWQK